MNTDTLAIKAKLLAELANLNLNSFAGKFRNPQKNDIQDYYIGLLRRQAILLIDLEIILNHRNPNLITTPYILLRSLLDDFLHVIYLELHKNREEEIVKITAKTYKQSFKAIENLTNSNHNHFNGQYALYLTNEELQEYKDTFSGKAVNDKYFIDKDNFRFKQFIPLSQVAENITHSRKVEIFSDRAFFLWKEFSTFVHYSTFSYYLENNPDTTSLYKMEEAFQYSYNTIYLSFKYFERNHNIEFIDSIELKEQFGKIYEC